MNRQSRTRCTFLHRTVGVLVGMLVNFSAMSYAANVTHSGRGVRGLAGTSPDNCWVFNHMNKSGGMTIRTMLLPWLKANGVIIGLFDDIEWSSGRDFAENYVQEKKGFTYGGYTEGLRMYESRDCKWFTVFRHPVSRVVSAYFYCHRNPCDQLCATIVMDASEVDLVTFAEHWGNYGLRQFALASVKSEDVFHNAAVSDFCEQARGHGDVCIPAWYRLKQFLRLSQQEDTSGTMQPESELGQFLSHAQETLNNRYAAVGIIEKWETTMKLFDKVLNLRGFEWEKKFQQTGKENGSGQQFESAEHRALEAAWQNTELKKFIWLDILLYDHALAVHRQQVADNGLM